MAFFPPNQSSLPNLVVQGNMVPVQPNRAHQESMKFSHEKFIGMTGAMISPLVLASPPITVSPQIASQVWTLPAASEILQILGRDPTTGQSRVAQGSVYNFQLINKGLHPCVIQGGTGSDGTAILCYTGGAGPIPMSGTSLSAFTTAVNLKWIDVNSGLNGCTGTYTIFV